MSLSVIVLLVVLFVLYLMYASLIAKKNKLKEAASGIEIQLKKRYDLIPNLLKMAAKFMAHEKDLMTEIVNLRNKALDNNFNQNPKEAMNLDTKISRKLKDFWVVCENYPDLKSNQTMVQAMQSFNEVEEHIAAARRFYNAALTDLKNAVETFPSSLIASLLGIKADMPFFKAEKEAFDKINAEDFF